MVWTDTDTIQAVVGQKPRAANFNAALGNLAHIWDDAPRITVRMTSNYTVANASDEVLQWHEAAWDSTGGLMWDAGTPGSIVVPAGGGGLYLGVGGHQWVGTNDDNSKRSAKVIKNGGAAGSDDLGGDDRLSTSSPRGTFTILSTFAAGDYVEVVSRQLSGGALDLMPYQTRFTFMLIGAGPSL